MSPRYRVFLSAVTSECGEARTLVASDLRSRGLEVKVQEDFRQEAGADATTLRKLHDYVKDCDRVVAIMGDRSGSFPPPDAAAPFKDMLPDGFERASLTQWEVHFARAFGKRMSIYVASNNFTPARAAAPNADDELQKRLRDYLFEHKGLDRSAFNSPEDLSRLILKERWPDYSRPPPKSDRFVSIGDLFKGRKEDIERLQERLEASGQSGAAAKAVALHGMGGLGKTRLGIEYGLAREKDYFGLLFLSGETPAALEASLQGLGRVLDIADQETMKEDARRRAVLDWLRENPSWFLVIDNIDTQEALKATEALLSNFSRGDVVVTSRLAIFSGVFEPLALDVLSEKASVEFLTDRTRNNRRATPEDDAEALAIARDLGQLALALEQAGAYIAYNGQSFADYRADWEKQRAEILGWFDETITGYPRSVADTFLTSFRHLSAPARRLLEHLAFLSPEPAPESLLDVDLAGVESSPKKLIAEIARYSLVTRQSAQRTFAMHRLVQDVVRRGLSAEEADARCVAAMNWLTAAVDPARRATSVRRRTAHDLALHAEAAAAHANSSKARQAASYLLSVIADAVIELGLFITALRLRATALDCAEREAKADRRDHERQRNLASCYIGVGDLQVDQGDLAAALGNYEAAAAICRAMTRKSRRNTRWQYHLGICTERIGNVQLARGDLTGALASYQTKLKIAFEIVRLDPGNATFRRDLAVAHGKVGDILFRNRDLPGALKHFREAAKITNILVAADPDKLEWQRDLSVSFSKIGDVSFVVGRKESVRAALDSYRKSLDIRKRLAETDKLSAGLQLDVCVAYERIGDANAILGDEDEARLAYRGAIENYETLITRNPEDVKSRLFSVAPRWRLARYDPKRAKEHLEAALAILEPLAAVDRLDAARTAWIPMIRADLAAVEKGEGVLTWAALEALLPQ